MQAKGVGAVCLLCDDISVCGHVDTWPLKLPPTRGQRAVTSLHSGAIHRPPAVPLQAFGRDGWQLRSCRLRTSLLLQSIEALRPRVLLWLGRMGPHAAALLAAPIPPPPRHGDGNPRLVSSSAAKHDMGAGGEDDGDEEDGQDQEPGAQDQAWDIGPCLLVPLIPATALNQSASAQQPGAAKASAQQRGMPSTSSRVSLNSLQ
jgi:hypothetical protein